ncbi:MAG: cache domain-containing protein, partial [Syntrophobacteraceae bacterium]
MNDSSTFSDAGERRYYASLTRNMVLGIMLVALTPLVLIAGLTGYYFETAYRHKVIETLTQLVEKHQQHINSYLNERLADIKFIANSYSYDQLSNEKFLRDTLSVLNRTYPDDFVDLGIVTPEGDQIAYAGKYKLLNTNYAKSDWFREAMKKEFYLSDVFPGVRRKPHFIVCVRKEVAGRQWLLRATVNFASFNSVVDEIHIGKTGSAFIVNRVGELQSGFPAKSGATVTMPPDNSGFVSIRLPLKSGDWALVYQQE